MTMMTFSILLAAGWVVQMLLNWRQAKRFMSEVAALREHGEVVIGRGKRRGLRSYAALAFRDGTVSGARILRGYSVFARAKGFGSLSGMSAQELSSAATIAGLDRRTAAAVANAATLYLEHRTRTAAAEATAAARRARVSRRRAATTAA